MLYLLSSPDLAQPISSIDGEFQHGIDIPLFKQHSLG
jgi:hypothetical protein